jgi:hypothetical protein
MLGVATAFTFLAAVPAFAGQCRDPWVTKAVQQVTGHQPNGSADNGECDYRRYGGGHWTTYDDLLTKVRTAFGASAPASISGVCRDAWVTQAVRQVTGRAPNGSGDNGECAVQRYGGGHWTSYDDLVGKVRVAFGMGVPQQSPYGNVTLAPKASDFTVSSTALGYSRGHGPARGSTVTYQGGQYQVVNVIAQGGGNLITDNGGGVIAQGGGNLQVTLRLINHDGASIVINHGSNMQGQQYRSH